MFPDSQVKQILIEGEGDAARAVGVRLADGRVFRGRTVVSNATRWDTFENLLGDQDMPEAEQLFRCLLYLHRVAVTSSRKQYCCHCMADLLCITIPPLLLKEVSMPSQQPHCIL